MWRYVGAVYHVKQNSKQEQQQASQDSSPWLGKDCGLCWESHMGELGWVKGRRVGQTKVLRHKSLRKGRGLYTVDTNYVVVVLKLVRSFSKRLTLYKLYW